MGGLVNREGYGFVLCHGRGEIVINARQQKTVLAILNDTVKVLSLSPSNVARWRWRNFVGLSQVRIDKKKLQLWIEQW